MLILVCHWGCIDPETVQCGLSSLLFVSIPTANGVFAFVGFPKPRG
jgi:hypothetical protein